MAESGEPGRDGGRTAHDGGERAAFAAPERRSARGRAAAFGAPLIAFATLVVATAHAQSGPTSPPPAAPPPASVPIEPLTAGPVNAPPTLVPGPFAAPAAPADAPPIVAAAAPDREPFYQKWWFWTAVGAVAVTTIAILIATSGSSPPHTDFGNMPAF